MSEPERLADIFPVVVADLARHQNVEIQMSEPILTETTRGLVRRLRHERRRARSESGRRQQQATQSMALVRSFASAVGVRVPNYMSTFGPKPHEYDACRAAALRLRADLIDARAQVAAVRALCKDAMKLPTLDDPRSASDRLSPRAVLAALDAAATPNPRSET